MCSSVMAVIMKPGLFYEYLFMTDGNFSVF